MVVEALGCGVCGGCQGVLKRSLSLVERWYLWGVILGWRDGAVSRNCVAALGRLSLVRPIRLFFVEVL